MEKRRTKGAGTSFPRANEEERGSMRISYDIGKRKKDEEKKEERNKHRKRYNIPPLPSELYQKIFEEVPDVSIEDTRSIGKMSPGMLVLVKSSPTHNAPIEREKRRICMIKCIDRNKHHLKGFHEYDRYLNERDASNWWIHNVDEHLRLLAKSFTACIEQLSLPLNLDLERWMTVMDGKLCVNRIQLNGLTFKTLIDIETDNGSPRYILKAEDEVRDDDDHKEGFEEGRGYGYIGRIESISHDTEMIFFIRRMIEAAARIMGMGSIYIDVEEVERDKEFL